MVNKKENRHPAATEMTVVEEVFNLRRENPRKNYNTNINKKQVLITMFFTLLVLLFTLKVISDASITFTPVEHTVRNGDTLWSIAKQYKPDDMTMDEYMAWVYDHNDSGMIYAGDVVTMAEVTR